MDGHAAQGVAICLLCKGRHFPGLLVPIWFPCFSLHFTSQCPHPAGGRTHPGAPSEPPVRVGTVPRAVPWLCVLGGAVGGSRGAGFSSGLSLPGAGRAHAVF